MSTLYHVINQNEQSIIVTYLDKERAEQKARELRELFDLFVIVTAQVFE